MRKSFVVQFAGYSSIVFRFIGFIYELISWYRA